MWNGYWLAQIHKKCDGILAARILVDPLAFTDHFFIYLGTSWSGLDFEADPFVIGFARNLEGTAAIAGTLYLLANN